MMATGYCYAIVQREIISKSMIKWKTNNRKVKIKIDL